MERTGSEGKKERESAEVAGWSCRNRRSCVADVPLTTTQSRQRRSHLGTKGGHGPCWLKKKKKARVGKKN